MSHYRKEVHEEGNVTGGAFNTLQRWCIGLIILGSILMILILIIANFLPKESMPCSSGPQPSYLIDFLNNAQPAFISVVIVVFITILFIVVYTTRKYNNERPL